MALFVADIAAGDLRQTAADVAQRNIEAIVRGYVDPTLREASLSPGAPADPETTAELDRLVASGGIRRINIWSRDGRIAYSTEPAIRGRQLPIDAALAAALSGVVVSVYSGSPSDGGSEPAAATENLELYVPIWSSAQGNLIGVYEVYQDAAPIENHVAVVRQDVFLVALVAASLLFGLLWLAYAATSRQLSGHNRLLRERAASEQVLIADLRRSEERFRSLVRNASDCILIARADETVAYESPAVARLLGYQPSSRIGRRAFEDVHPDDVSLVKRLFHEVTATPDAQASGQFRVRHADGSWRYLEASARNLLGDAAVRGVVVNYRDITERRQLEEQLRHQAFHDALTGLPNRALFMDRLQHARSRSRGKLPDLAVVFLDLDDFKAVNDSFGHAAGDELLVEVARRIQRTVREGDTVARMGGDEFAIVLEEARAEEASEIAGRLLEVLREPCIMAGQQVVVHATAGIAIYSDQRESADELLRNADVAMYTGKTHGKGRLTVFRASLHDGAIERLQLKTDLHAALERGEFSIVYQPVVELASAEVRGVEALLRWTHPRLGDVSPTQFIPLAEETGLIVPLGQWVLREACRQAAEWRLMAAGVRLSMAVNLSARQVQHPDLVADVGSALRDTGLPPDQLTLEITESVLMQDVDSTTVTLRSLKALGVRLAIDDFGTGYSSLSYLRRFPVDILKIDRSFVATLDSSDTEAALVRSIVGLGKTLNLETIAEGIDHAGQLVKLRALGAIYGQGFLFAMPLGKDEMTELLRGGESGRVAIVMPVAVPAGADGGVAEVRV